MVLSVDSSAVTYIPQYLGCNVSHVYRSRVDPARYDEALPLRSFISFCWISDAPRDLVSIGAVVFPAHFGFRGIPSCSSFSVTCHLVWA